MDRLVVRVGSIAFIAAPSTSSVAYDTFDQAFLLVDEQLVEEAILSSVIEGRPRR